jgi:hypothetical protein
MNQIQSYQKWDENLYFITGLGSEADFQAHRWDISKYEVEAESWERHNAAQIKLSQLLGQIPLSAVYFKKMNINPE